MTIGTGIAIIAIWGGTVGIIYVTGWNGGAAVALVTLAVLLTFMVTP